MHQQLAKNILGEDLQLCCIDPKTGFFRDGFCNTNHIDQGTHVICAVVTDEFLEFTRSRGNDLRTPMPGYDFPGLKPGDGWCLCALRWKEAHEAGVAPPIKARSTHARALDFIDAQTLALYRVD
ncbi:MAG: DUF2237 domain-containing protein [Devosiaceae bacterium]|nr:DUF2237 domain-containing protein [Devosiaceae bacterium MH13]